MLILRSILGSAGLGPMRDLAHDVLAMDVNAEPVFLKWRQPTNSDDGTIGKDLAQLGVVGGDAKSVLDAIKAAKDAKEGLSGASAGIDLIEAALPLLAAIGLGA